ncbi:hypothetical protein [Coleofasciculus sp. FACHB-SPT36]|uniref:hypothetical protein n=1 Tax=Cyanophyceae TaxID=3028117 RepID=UPI00168AD167|nr:hypothetical protein [Coleofasciculus sp. FACHB-SPT36]MBD2541520.1 hypothetical protein [Coleofasciculus sp. FACHB-SPT36]
MSAGAGDFLFTGVVEHTGRPKRANQKAIAHAKTQAKNRAVLRYLISWQKLKS